MLTIHNSLKKKMKFVRRNAYQSNGIHMQYDNNDTQEWYERNRIYFIHMKIIIANNINEFVR